MAIAVSALAIVSCTKADKIELQEATEGYRYSFALVDEAATKASLGTTGVTWESGDKVGIYLAQGNKYASINNETTPKTVVLYSTAPIPAGTIAYTYYPYLSDNSSSSNTKITLNKVQTGGVSSMPLAGIPFEIVTETEANSNGTIKFLNLASIIEFNVFSSNATYQTETVQSITFKTNDGSILSGDGYIDLTTVSPTNESSLVLNFSDANNRYDVVKVNQAVPVANSKDNATPVYMAIRPGTFSGTIVIQTDMASYTFTFSNKTLSRNGLKHYNMNLSNASRVEKTYEDYSLFTGDIVEGDYIVYYNGNALKAAISSNRMENEPISPDNDIISTNNDAIVWHIAPSATSGFYTFYNAREDGYLAATSNNNQAQLLNNGTGDLALFTITNNAGQYDVVNKSNERFLRQNGASGWAMYAENTGGRLKLYYKDPRTPFTPPASVNASINSSDNTVIDVSFSTVTGASSYGIIATPSTGDPVIKTGIVSSPTTISVADGLGYNTTYTISVYAVPSNTTTYKNSDAVSAPGTVTTGSIPEGYELITSTSDVTTGLYIIAAKKEGHYYAMSNTFAGKIDGTSVTANNFISSTDGENYVVSITNNGSTYTIASGSQILGYSSSTHFTTGGGGTTSWTLSSGINGTFRFTISGGSRVIAFNGEQFGAYAASNVVAGSSSYFDVELFKFNGTIKIDPTTTVSPSSPIALTVGNTQQLTVNTNSDGSVTYSSSNESVATISTTGLITAVSAGISTISVATAATSTYNAGSIEIVVNVSNPGSSVSFDTSDFSGQGTSSTGSPISATKSGITFSCDKGFGTTQIRCYSGSEITISADEGKKITGINFTFSGSYNGGLSVSYTGLNTSSWSKTLSSQARIMEVSVSYE